MSNKPDQSGRTNPPGNDEGSDSDDEVNVRDAFSKSASGRFRSKVIEYQNQSRFPTAPLYRIDDEVYLIVTGQSQPAGPYLITAILANRRYNLKRKDTSEAVTQSVSENDLVVRTA
ncbi:hypothetical protein MMC17_001694 [Xylographa soralifera]|nr:hypothetical protein [Xylographa soralifera]